jgi:hypothetical protein
VAPWYLFADVARSYVLERLDRSDLREEVAMGDMFNLCEGVIARCEVNEESDMIVPFVKFDEVLLNGVWESKPLES